MRVAAMAAQVAKSREVRRAAVGKAELAIPARAPVAVAMDRAAVRAPAAAAAAAVRGRCLIRTRRRGKGASTRSMSCVRRRDLRRINVGVGTRRFARISRQPMIKWSANPTRRGKRGSIRRVMAWHRTNVWEEAPTVLNSVSSRCGPKRIRLAARGATRAPTHLTPIAPTVIFSAARLGNSAATTST
jgi:hypothetical protein